MQALFCRVARYIPRPNYVLPTLRSLLLPLCVAFFWILAFVGITPIAYACPDISTITNTDTLVVSFPDARTATAANLAAAEGRLTYDATAKALKFCNGTDWVNLLSAPIPASDRNEHGTLPLGTGTAARLYTEYVTLEKGVYMVQFYNCLSGSSTEHYVHTTGEAQSGDAWCGGTNSAFSQLSTYTGKTFICKVRSTTASLRFFTWNPNGTITNAHGCSNFEYVNISN